MKKLLTCFTAFIAANIVAQTYNTWVALENGNASDGGNWSMGVPQAGQIIVLDSSSTADMYWDAGTGGLPDTVGGWLQDGDYTGTVMFPTTYDAQVFPVFTITGDVTAGGGKWTHPNNGSVPEYWLNIVVNGDFTLGPDAEIDLWGGNINLRGRGFYQTNGPGATSNNGSAHGGYGGYTTYGGWGSAHNNKTYGSILAPCDLGSGGSWNLAGGGAVRLEVKGAARIDGKITAEGAHEWNRNASSSGGSIHLIAGSLDPASSGKILANGGTDGNHGHGGGGRVSVVAGDGEIPDNVKTNGSPVDIKSDSKSEDGESGSSTAPLIVFLVLVLAAGGIIAWLMKKGPKYKLTITTESGEEKPFTIAGKSEAVFGKLIEDIGEASGVKIRAAKSEGLDGDATDGFQISEPSGNWFLVCGTEKHAVADKLDVSRVFPGGSEEYKLYNSEYAPTPAAGFVFDKNR